MSFRQLVIKTESLRVCVDTAVGMLVLSDQRHYIVEPAANIAKDPHGSATYDVAIGVRGVTHESGLTGCVYSCLPTWSSAWLNVEISWTMSCQLFGQLYLFKTFKIFPKVPRKLDRFCLSMMSMHEPEARRRLPATTVCGDRLLFTV